MKYSSFLFLAVLVSVTNLAMASTQMLSTDADYRFSPVVGVSSRTIEQWHATYDRAPLGNINTTFLANALSLGILPRFEVGTTPLFYGLKGHLSNYIMKWNFWRDALIDTSLGYSELRFKVDIQTEQPDVVMRATQLSFNIHPESITSSFGVFATNVCGYIDSKNSLVYIYSYKCETEYGLDWQVPLTGKSSLTVGFGQLRQMGFSAYEAMSSGAGVAYTWFRPKSFISRPSVGVFHYAEKGSLFLFSTTFYED